MKKSKVGIIPAVFAVAMSLASYDSQTSTSVDIIGGADAPTSIVVADRNGAGNRESVKYENG